jgi:hypothetical protein
VALGEEHVDINEVKQRLNKAQHVIAQLYQENRELRRQLAERIPKKQASQSKAGWRSPRSPTEGENNIKWLEKQLREAQNEIIKLKEESRISEEGIMEHFKKCRQVIDDACVALSDAQ